MIFFPALFLSFFFSLFLLSELFTYLSIILSYSLSPFNSDERLCLFILFSFSPSLSPSRPLAGQVLYVILLLMEQRFPWVNQCDGLLVFYSYILGLKARAQTHFLRPIVSTLSNFSVRH